MIPELYTEREVKISGWPVRLTSYRLGDEYHCQADNVSPGAWLVRVTAPTREEAEKKATDRARRLLSRTKRQTAA